MTVVGALLLAATADATAGVREDTVSFVVVSLKTAGVESPYLDECPQGLAIGNDEIWWKALSPRERDVQTGGGTLEPSARRITATLRGPKGEDVCWNPAAVRDPPLRVIQNGRSPGFNLDGTADGAATPQSCAHAKFPSPDGSRAVDNQLRRLTGCIHGWRSNGYIELTSDTERRNSSSGVILMTVTGVRSLVDSPDVTVRFFRAADVMRKDSHGDILAYASYRIDGNPRYGATAHGRIVKGVLTTDPIDAHLPFYGNRVETEFFIRGLRLELTLADDGASGLMGGYHDLANWWDYVRKMGYLVETAQFSCPALYAAAQEMADGYPDPRTGACTALSVAYDVKAVRAFVITEPPPLPVPATEDPVPPAPLPAGIGTQLTPIGTVLTDSTGRTLYAATASACTKTCAGAFVPLTAAWAAIPTGDWIPVMQPDGARQWTFHGAAVFTCRQDGRPGEAGCGEPARAPLVVNPPGRLPPWITVQRTEVGPAIADSRGHTLYRFIGDLNVFKREICDEACFQKMWHTVSAEGGAATGAFTIVPGPTGEPVWGYQGRPLYVFAGDESPGEIAGHRFGGASVSVKNWFSAIPLREALGTAP